MKRPDGVRAVLLVVATVALVGVLLGVRALMGVTVAQAGQPGQTGQTIVLTDGTSTAVAQCPPAPQACRIVVR